MLSLKYVCISATTLPNKVPNESQPIQKVHILDWGFIWASITPTRDAYGGVVGAVQWNGSLCPGDQWWLMSVNNFPDNSLGPVLSAPASLTRVSVTMWRDTSVTAPEPPRHSCHAGITGNTIAISDAWAQIRWNAPSNGHCWGIKQIVKFKFISILTSELFKVSEMFQSNFSLFNGWKVW